VEHVSIIGIGEVLDGDSGVGCYILEMLSREPLTDSVQLFYLGRDPRYAGGYLYAADMAIVVGALELESVPGKIHHWSYPIFRRHAGWISREYPWVGYLGEAFLRVEMACGLPKETLFLWIEPAVKNGFILSDAAHCSMWRTVRIIVRKLIERGWCETSARHCLVYPLNPTLNSDAGGYVRNPLSEYHGRLREPTR
jgi:hydrogenase maturation protease